MPSSANWTILELFGQRKLLGLGALLAWIVLFHLLVNVWLLCVFTSLLVVFGGWLGSRAALDANSLLHLEHFLPLGRVNPPVYSPEQEWRLNHEIHSAVQKAVRDFVSSWYRTLLPEVEGEFERAVRSSMLESVMELKERAQRVDRKALVQRLLELYGCHLQSYMAVKQIQKSQRESVGLWQLYREVETPHPAVSSPTAELNYSRALVNVVLHALVPYPQMETRTGGYMVTELITCNVMLPLISRISDPDWLNQTIVDLFTKSRDAGELNKEDLQPSSFYMCQNQYESWTTCRSLSSVTQSDLSSISSSDVDEPKDLSPVSIKYSPESSLASTDNIPSCHARLRPVYGVSCCPSSAMSKMVSMDSFLPSDSEDDLSRGFCECGPPAGFCSFLPLKDEDAFGCFGPLRNFGPKPVVPEDSHWPAGIAQEKSLTYPGKKLCPGTFNCDSVDNEVTPVNIQKIQIAGTVSGNEQRGTGTHPYTLYTVKFETASDGDCAGNIQPAACHSVNRRYSEFLNLQARLEDKPEMRKLIKNIRGPKKTFPDLQFGSPDNEKVEARRSQLDVFLKQLSTIPETANSEDMQEFLALSSDECSYFGRRPFNKSRIDKMMENALDTLRTAFPHPDLLSPVEDIEADNDGRTMDNRKYRRLFPSKVSPSLHMPDLHPRVSYCYSEGSAVLNGMSLSGLEGFVQEHERLVCGPDAAGSTGRNSQLRGKENKLSGRAHSTDTAVADVALNILCLLMKDQWSWLCTENIQKAIRLLFGTFIERWLEVGAAHLTSAHCWVIYLQVLQEAVWPGGMLPAQPPPEQSAAEREETKERCLRCLMQLLPEFITEILGHEKYKMSLETMLGSVQDHQINKHLVFCICDLLLEFLIPESCDEALQRTLLQSLAKSAGRDSPNV